VRAPRAEAVSEDADRSARAGAGPEEPPPVLGRWSRLYALLAVELLVTILALYWLTRRFA
jgi:hypothetical protein